MALQALLGRNIQSTQIVYINGGGSMRCKIRVDNIGEPLPFKDNLEDAYGYGRRNELRD